MMPPANISESKEDWRVSKSSRPTNLKIRFKDSKKSAECGRMFIKIAERSRKTEVYLRPSDETRNRLSWTDLKHRSRTEVTCFVDCKERHNPRGQA